MPLVEDLWQRAETKIDEADHNVGETHPNQLQEDAELMQRAGQAIEELQDQNEELRTMLQEAASTLEHYSTSAAGVTDTETFSFVLQIEKLLD